MIAASLLAEPACGEEAARLISKFRLLLAPAHWQAELANVVWKATILGHLPVDKVDSMMSVAAHIPIISVDINSLWRGAVARSIASGHPVYDTLFAERAVRENTHVASYDKRFQRRFPEIVLPPVALLQS